MAAKRNIKKFDVSLLVTITSIAVLAVISAIMVMTHFQKQEQRAQELFIEKGATLIRSFEAGIREATGDKDFAFRMQKLLMATAQQPDIDYLIVTDHQGTVMADSDPSMIYQKYGLDLNLTVVAQKADMHWRQTANPDGAGTFEVYRGGLPVPVRDASGDNGLQAPQIQGIVFVGFNMEKIETAMQEDTRNTIIFTLIFLLIGSSAIVSLYLVWDYRLTRLKLSRMKAFSDTLVKNMPIGLIASGADGKIISCNEKSREILSAISPDMTPGNNVVRLPLPLTRLLDELPAKSDLLERDIEISLPDGERLMLEAVAARLEDDDAPAGKILLFRDVSHIRRMEKEVARSRHLSSISSLAAGVAHEIRNPLSSIKGFAVYLKERLRTDSEDVKIADIIVEEVERLNRVITQLIEFARPLDVKKEPIRLSDIIKRTITLIESQAKKNNIDVMFTIDGDESAVDADPDKVRQVFLNIFLNAIEASHSGGRLAVTLTREREHALVAVADNGAGISEGDLPRIYDPYFTSKPSGTGLGLAVVQKIMDAHGGKMDVQSARGKGTTVSLLFPLEGARNFNKEVGR